MKGKQVTLEGKSASKELDAIVLDQITQAVIDQGIKAGLVEVRKARIHYVSVGKTYSLTDPEEAVRARVYIILITKYGYSPRFLDTEVVSPRREPKLPADIVIFRDNEHTKPYAVVETKANSTENDILEAKREGLGNANLHRGAEYLLCVCGEEEFVFDVKTAPALKQLDDCRIAQLPINFGLTPQYKFKRGEPAPFGLRKTNLNELKTKFERCHNTIWEGGKRDPATSFDEMSKLMFAKIFDEVKETGMGEYYKFQIGTNENHSMVARRIEALYSKAQRNEPDVFKTEIDLPDNLIYEIVLILQDISLTETDLDSKGQAFEHFIGKYFRGDYGQFFTPRKIVQFMIDVIKPTEEDLIIDPACGSGGFLLYVLKTVRDRITKKFEGDEKTIQSLQKDFALKGVWGIEVNDKIARIAMMDMVIHEDGHSNIEATDALKDPSLFDPRKEIALNKYTVCLTNPPFGNDILRDAEYFKDYVFGSKIETERKSQKSEIMFIERCLDLLVDTGKLGIVLPDSAYTNIGNIEVCDHLFKTCRIRAIVSLPQFTFTPFGSDAKTSLVFLEKDKNAKARYEQKILLENRINAIRADTQISRDEKKKHVAKEKELAEEYDYPIFMAHITKVGHDATGREDENYLNEDVLKELIRFEQTPATYSGVYRNEDFWTVKVSYLDLSDKLDVEAYSSEYFETSQKIESSKGDVKTLGQIATIYSGWNAEVSSQTKIGAVPLIKTADVKKIIQTKDTVNGETVGFVYWEGIDSFVSLEDYYKRSEKQLKLNDILVQSVAHTRRYIADKISLVDSIPEKFSGNAMALGKFLVVRVTDMKVDPMYLAMFLASPLGKIQLLHYVRGMTAEIYERDIRDLLVVLPDSPVQSAIGSNALSMIMDFLDYQRKIDSLKMKFLDATKSVEAIEGL